MDHWAMEDLTMVIGYWKFGRRMIWQQENWAVGKTKFERSFK